MNEFQQGDPWKIITYSYYTDDLHTFRKAMGWSRRNEIIRHGTCAYVHATAQWDDLRNDEYNQHPKFFDILNEAMRLYKDTYFVQFVFRPDDVSFEFDPSKGE